MVTDPMAELTLRLPPELHQAVKDAARAADLSMAQWIRRAIRAALTDGATWDMTGGVPTKIVFWDAKDGKANG